MAVRGDSYCGIYCGACSVAMHGETGRADGFIACCRGIPRAELACGGCKSESPYLGCRSCDLRTCAAARGVAHCGECAEYPCKSYRHWQSAARILPHVAESADSIASMKRGGVDAWLEAQATRWSCSECGTPFSWYAPSCPGCGRSLAADAFTLTGIRRLVARLLIPSAFRKGKAKSARV